MVSAVGGWARARLAVEASYQHVGDPEPISIINHSVLLGRMPMWEPDDLMDRLPLDAIVAALQDLPLNTDLGLRNDPAKNLSDRVYRPLRGQVAEITRTKAGTSSTG